MLELPAGRIDPGELPLAAGKRELLEETGYRAAQWKKALFFYPSPGFLEETMTVFWLEILSQERLNRRMTSASNIDWSLYREW